jgi:hypothetical protein
LSAADLDAWDDAIAELGELHGSDAIAEAG